MDDVPITEACLMTFVSHSSCQPYLEAHSCTFAAELFSSFNGNMWRAASATSFSRNSCGVISTNPFKRRAGGSSGGPPPAPVTGAGGCWLANGAQKARGCAGVRAGKLQFSTISDFRFVSLLFQRSGRGMTQAILLITDSQVRDAAMRAQLSSNEKQLIQFAVVAIYQHRRRKGASAAILAGGITVETQHDKCKKQGVGLRILRILVPPHPPCRAIKMPGGKTVETQRRK